MEDGTASKEVNEAQRSAQGEQKASRADAGSTEAAAAQPEGGASTQQKPDELAILKDRTLRLQADFDNFRKRTVRDREEHNRRANEKILSDLLPVLDHFELGLQAARKQHIKHSVIEGLGAVYDQLRAVLERAGVEPIETEGKTFDPQFHECVSHSRSDKHPENTVVAETRKGYRAGNFVLRPAQVMISSGAGQQQPAKNAEEPGTESSAPDTGASFEQDG